MISHPDTFRDLLRQALTTLALNPDQQIKYLIEHRVDVDELALELDDISGLLPELVERGYVPRPTAELIAIIDARFTTMSGSENADLWTDTALSSNPRWAEIRALARAALAALDGQY